MRTRFHRLKQATGVIVSAIGICACAVALYVNFAPQFGAQPQGEHLVKISASIHFQNGVFVNQVETIMDYGLLKTAKMIRDFLTVDNINPTDPLPVKFAAGNAIVALDTLTSVTWYGHSAFLLEMEGKRLLLDPMFGPAASPFSFVGQRYAYQQPIDLEQFTKIDAVLISHDHYDHLDYSSIVKLQPHVGHFFVPLGVGAHLIRWGVAEDKITELDWWESAAFKDLTFTAAPARHFSGRALSDRNKTQWASWVLQGQYNNLYFSGDGGYAPHFKEIGDKYGPFDLTLVECGQYNQRWEAIHMMPEQSLQANIDLRGKVVMPIHWGAFDLALHKWRDPVSRLLAAAEKQNIKVATPYIGERFIIGQDVPHKKWWETLN